MRRFRTTIVLALATLLFVSICSAQQASTTAVPNLIRYDGTLKDAQSAAVSSATVGVIFAIYKQQDGGAPVWQETQNVTTDASGKYSVLLGSTTATGLPDDLFSQQEQRWLGIQVQGQAEQARVLLVSVPYAFKAHEAETLGGLPASAFVKAAPDEAPSDGSNGTALNALSAVGNAGGISKAKRRATSAKPAAFCNTANPVTSNTGGPFGTIPLWGAVSCDLENSIIVQSPATATGNIGIGTTTPAAKLDVNGSINANGSINTTYQYRIGPFAGRPVLQVPGSVGNLWVGVGAGIGSGGGGQEDTFLGGDAGINSGGDRNTYVGSSSGANAFSLSGTNNNTFTGAESGYNNTASNGSFYGYKAGYANIANNNSFFGFSAGMANTSGSNNTFLGNLAGTLNDTGSGDTFVGDSAGAANMRGIANTFVGLNAGKASTSDANTFIGSNAGTSNRSSLNTFVGQAAGSSNVNGHFNTFVGSNAGMDNLGTNNVFLGIGAGGDNTTGNNDIYIGNLGCPYPCPESSTIRIGGDVGAGYGAQTAAFIAGIFNSTMAKAPTDLVVCVNPSGGLYGAIAGTTCTLSARRFKENILDMGDSSSKLFQLRPVTFFYKPQYDDGSHSLQYGLIAEEVAKVFPEMAVYDKEGQPYTVKYQMLAPMLLNELQKQHTVVATQQDVIKAQQQQIQTQGQQIVDLQERLSRLESLIVKK